MVRRGLARSREHAAELIAGGRVTVAGQSATKSATAVGPGEPVVVKQDATDENWASRGARKLAGALDAFDAVHVTGRRCLDAGASTGGFTDVLLQAGALRVHAVDCGAGQLDWKLRTDPRVIMHEGINARSLSFQDIGELVDFLCCDVSFISVTLILPAVTQLLQPAGQMVILIKPQFEVGKGQVGKGGIVRQPELHQAACEKVERAVREMGFQTAIIESPIAGAEGNKEFLLYARH